MERDRRISRKHTFRNLLLIGATVVTSHMAVLLDREGHGISMAEAPANSGYTLFIHYVENQKTLEVKEIDAACKY